MRIMGVREYSRTDAIGWVRVGMGIADGLEYARTDAKRRAGDRKPVILGLEVRASNAEMSA